MLNEVNGPVLEYITHFYFAFGADILFKSQVKNLSINLRRALDPRTYGLPMSWYIAIATCTEFPLLLITG